MYLTNTKIRLLRSPNFTKFHSHSFINKLSLQSLPEQLEIYQIQSQAIIEISTFTSLGNLATCTVSRAGYFPSKYEA